MADLSEDEREQALLNATAELTAALRRLYELTDGDEAQVGEIEHECHKAARTTRRSWLSEDETEPCPNCGAALRPGSGKCQDCGWSV